MAVSKLRATALAGTVAAALLAHGGADARPDTRRTEAKRAARPTPTAPCERCVLDVPAARARGSHAEPAPLLVVLHGDREHARDAAARWLPATRARGWILLALEVPDDDSWWRWGGEPDYIVDRVAEVTRAVDVDPARIYLAGWSGGASYIGLRATAWSTVFAGLVIHGGGQPPWDATCAAAGARRLPVYFLVGNENPLHHLAKGLRAYFEDCGHVVRWDLLRWAAHRQERRALTRAKGSAILAWLLAQTEKPGG